MRVITDKSGSKWLTITVFSLTMAFLLAQTVEVLGGGLSSPWKKGKQKADESKTSASGVESPMKQAAHDEQIAQAVTSTSTVPKLFWANFGINNDSKNWAGLLYVDPSASTPTRVLYDSNTFVGSGMGDDGGNGLGSHTFVTGTVNTTTYQITNLQPRYIFYFKGGKIWLVDTITLKKRRLSTEAGIKENTLVHLNNLINWQTPGDNTIQYQLTGPDGVPDTGDDIVRAVKIGMRPTDAPINLSPRHISALLLDGSYITNDFNSTPHKIERCSSNFTSFTLITNFSNWVDDVRDNYDARRVIIRVDGVIKSYDYVANTLVILYTPGANADISDSRLDRDGGTVNNFV